ncbi:MAG: histone deacetylase family protein [Halioglobus sp.]|nr:histone deacetylase family protein [Halioglobus sp.]
MAIAYISHPDCRLHDMGRHHPEQPARLAAIDDRLIASGLDAVLQHHRAQPVARSSLAAVHGASYVNDVFARAPRDGVVWLDGDTAMNEHSLRAARLAAGAVVMGVELALAGEAARVFCAVRPPGHHAERDKAMGFCFFNNVAVGAYHAIDAHGLQRVAIVDFDVHHGNGTEDIVAGDERVLFCSTFQHPFYPHSGAGSAAPNVVNVPLPQGTDGTEFRRAVQQYWLPRLAAFAPQLILVSAGFDAHRADPMANLNLVAADYAWVTRQLCRQSQRSASGRIVSTLEGGYDLDALARSVEAHLKAFLDD